MQRPAEIPSEAFQDILDELQRQPLAVNAYRKRAGLGRSQTFGLVNRRCLPPDYSRECWKRPLLYKHLLDFAEKYVDISWNAITVNQGYRAAAHRDKGNEGVSYLVGCGDYQGGALQILEGDSKGVYDIRHRPIIESFGDKLHSVDEFQGNRISLVFYTLKFKGNPPTLPPPSVTLIDGRWKFKRGEEVCNGLPHPLKGRKKDSGL